MNYLMRAARAGTYNSSVLVLVFLGILGLLIGSFANVVIHRLPRNESIVYPGSACPRCGYRLKPWENIPVVSWLMLRGRCSSCGGRISVRYPLIELTVAAGFVLIALRWPLELYGPTLFPLVAVFAMLVMMAVIDIDHYLLPDSLTLPALIVAVLGAFAYHPAAGLPTPAEALFAAGLGAGIIVLVNRIGSLVLRRFADTEERLWPIGMDQVNVAALFGALGGWLTGLAAAAASVLANVFAGQPLRISEATIYALWLAAIAMSLLAPWIDIIGSVSGSLVAAGGVAVIGAMYWWIADISGGTKSVSEQRGAREVAAEDEPVAMGFGDAKLAAVLGAILGWQSLLVALFLSFVIGAAGGLLGRALGGGRQVPFGPYLVAGALIALFFGQTIVAWYLGALGLP